MNKLYLFKRPSDNINYDEAREILVCAPNAKEARRWASISRYRSDEGSRLWLDPKEAKCTCIGTALPKTRLGILMVDVLNG